ncbi:MAG: sugar transferase [Acidobacteriota bacterium]
MSRSSRDYCGGRIKRTFDLIASLIGVTLLGPLLGVLAALVFVSSGRPIFFVQDRVGMGGKTFRLLKLRTMRASGGGPPITAEGDARVTGLGRFLRASKLDELPQLINVLRGDMSLVGPRPEVPQYVARYDAAQRRVLEVRPGLTDPATILFRDEERLLGAVSEADRERFYLEEVLPRKLALNLEYVERASLLYDLALIARTVGVVLLPGRR